MTEPAKDLFQAAMRHFDTMFQPVTDPEDRACFNCGNHECRDVQRKTCDLKESSCDEWEHDFPAMQEEARGAFRRHPGDIDDDGPSNEQMEYFKRGGR